MKYTVNHFTSVSFHRIPIIWCQKFGLSKSKWRNYIIFFLWGLNPTPTQIIVVVLCDVKLENTWKYKMYIFFILVLLILDNGPVWQTVVIHQFIFMSHKYDSFYMTHFQQVLWIGTTASQCEQFFIWLCNSLNACPPFESVKEMFVSFELVYNTGHFSNSSLIQV